MNVPDVLFVQGIIAGLLIALAALTLSGAIAWAITEGKQKAPGRVAARAKGNGKNYIPIITRPARIVKEGIYHGRGNHATRTGAPHA